MKKLGIIMIIILVLSAALIISKNIIAKNALSAGVKSITGLNLSMESIDVNVFKSSIGIKDLKLYNPSGFPDKLMVNMPEIYVDYNLGAFFKKKIHLEKIKLNLREFVVVRNEKGELNLDSLKVSQAEKQKKSTQEKKENGKRAKLPDLRIDILELKIGKVIFKDYSRGTQPEVKEFKVNIDERYENITDPYSFVTLIVTKALMDTAIGGLADFDLGPLKEVISGTFKKTTEAAGDIVDKPLDLGVEVEKAADMLKEVLPFGE